MDSVPAVLVAAPAVAMVLTLVTVALLVGNRGGGCGRRLRARTDRQGGRRLEETREFFAFMRAELPVMLERWQQHRRTLHLE